jgi:hypothetical protein
MFHLKNSWSISIKFTLFQGQGDFRWPEELIKTLICGQQTFAVWLMCDY